MRRVSILGATGSVGASTMDVLRAHPGEFSVSGLASRRPADAIIALAGEFPGAAVAVSDAGDGFARRLRAAGWRGAYFHGPDAVERLVREVEAEDCVLAMGGTSGLRPAFAAAELGRRILLANKEVLVAAGELFMAAAKRGGARVLPLDSEHAALWQCLDGRRMDEVEKVTITASGGPFRTWTREEMEGATVEQALRHPVWRMGRKISIDSATMANKVLELFEARHLFGLEFSRLDVLVHPQSVVHGMVTMCDGSVLAHMGVADMRQPIMHMLLHPDKRDGGFGRVNLAAAGRLDFERPDRSRFPLLDMGWRVGEGEMGGCGEVVFNAANEVAVGRFLAGRMPFGGIARSVAGALHRFGGGGACVTVEEVIALHGEVGAWVRSNEQ